MFYGWYIVGACSLIMMYIGGSIYLGFTSVFEPIVNEFGWSHTQISLAASLRGLETGLLAPIAGMLMDRWGPRRVVFGGIILSSLGLILLSRVTSLTMFYASFILMGTGVSATTNALLMVAVLNWFRKKAGLAMGIASSGVALGGLLVPLITFISDTFGWRQAMFIMGLGMLAVPLPLSLLLRHKPEKYGYLPNSEESGLSLDDDHSISEKSEEVNAVTKEALTVWAFWIIATAFICQVLALSGVITHIMPYLSSIGIERSTSSLIAGALPLMTVVGRVGFGWFGDRVDKRGVVALAFALNSLGVFILAFITTGQTWLIVVFIIIYGVGWGGAVIMLAGLMKAYFGMKRLGTIIGFAGFFTMMGGIAGAPLAGWVFDRWGDYQPAWFVFAGILGTATFFFAGLRDPSHFSARSA